MSLLSVDALQVSYGATPALFDVSLSVAEGEVLALMGRNGMGKSTTVKAICRMLPISAGSLRLDGHDIAALRPHQVARRGVGLVPEGRRCFRKLSVRENLIAAARPGDWTLSTVGELFPRLAERLGQPAASLSGGEQQMLALGRALMTNPRLLILDEATEGLAPLVRQEIWSAIARLKTRTGLSIVVVDKSLRELSQVADRATLLERGATVWEGGMAALPASVVERYLGV